MKTLRRLARPTYVTDPETGKRYPIPAGGSSDDPPPADPPSDPPADPPADPPSDDPPADPEPTALEQQALDAIQSLKDAGAEIPDALNAVVKEFRDARREAGNHRTAKTAEKERADAAEQKLGEVLKLLGVDDGDGDPDPDQLQSAIADKDKALTAKTVEFDAYRTAAKVTDPQRAPHGVNPDALLDSASFLAKAAMLDPTSDSYKTDLESAIKNAAENNPLLAAASPGGGRRGPVQGPVNTPTQQPASMEDAFAAHYQ